MKRFLMSFVYAKNGLLKSLKEERNLRLHFVTGFYVLLFSVFYNFTRAESMLLLLIIGGIIALELMNSAIERAVDKPLSQHYNTAGQAKDMAAAGVLVFAIFSAICGVMLFWDIQAFGRIFAFFKGKPILLVALIISMLWSYLSAFKTRKEDN